MICQKLCTEKLFIAVPSDHPLAIHNNGLYAKDLAGKVMLLMNDIGIWQKVVDEKMSQTKFIPQENIVIFNDLVRSSSIPSFVTSITLKYGTGPENFLYLPLLDPELTMTFYGSVRKQHRTFLPTLDEIN